MFREFEAKQRELQQWAFHSKSNKIKRYLNQKDPIEHVFAVGIYYRYVIAPLTKTGDFFERLESGNDAGLIVGGHKISPQYRKSILAAQLHFNNVLEKYGLDEAFFALTDVKQIVMSLIGIDERRQDGQD